MKDHIYALKYYLKYDCNDGKGFTKEEILKESKTNEDMGASDTLILTSLVKPKDGSLSLQVYSFDGKNEGREVSAIDHFKAWNLMAAHLSVHPSLGRLQREIARQAFKCVQDLIKMARETEADNDD